MHKKSGNVGVGCRAAKASRLADSPRQVRPQSTSFSNLKSPSCWGSILAVDLPTLPLAADEAPPHLKNGAHVNPDNSEGAHAPVAVQGCAMPSRNERKTENIVRDELRRLGYYAPTSGIIVEEQKSDLARLQQLLEHASKKGEGVGKPEFIIRSTDHADAQGRPAPPHHARQGRAHRPGGHPPSHLQGRALPRVLAHQREPLQRPAVPRAVAQELPRPGAALGRRRPARCCPAAAFPTASAALSDPAAATAGGSAGG
jgi:hypothetical protein